MRLQPANATDPKRKNIPDGEKGTVSASTKGNTVAITRQAIINDELYRRPDELTFRGAGGMLPWRARTTAG
jgi:hypothetical protein